MGQILKTFVATERRAECDRPAVRPTYGAPVLDQWREAGVRRDVDLVRELPDGE